MRKSLREVIFIPTAPSEERVQLLKPMNEIEELDDDSEEVHTSSLLNRYMQRSASLENISFHFTGSLTNLDDLNIVRPIKYDKMSHMTIIVSYLENN